MALASGLSPIFVCTQQFDSQGRVLAGGKVYTYLTGTSTPAATYTNALVNQQLPNPIILDAAGRFNQEIWLVSGTTYRFVLTDKTGTIISTTDGVTGRDTVGAPINNNSGISPIYNAIRQYDNQGLPLSYGKIYTYKAGTTEPYPTYSDSALTTPNPNPYILDSTGYPVNDMWLRCSVYYKFVLKDSKEDVIQTADYIYGCFCFVGGPVSTPITGLQANCYLGHFGIGNNLFGLQANAYLGTLTPSVLSWPYYGAMVSMALYGNGNPNWDRTVAGSAWFGNAEPGFPMYYYTTNSNKYSITFAGPYTKPVFNVSDTYRTYGYCSNYIGDSIALWVEFLTVSNTLICRYEYFSDANYSCRLRYTKDGTNYTYPGKSNALTHIYGDFSFTNNSIIYTNLDSGSYYIVSHTVTGVDMTTCTQVKITNANVTTGNAASNNDVNLWFGFGPHSPMTG
jgi:hypothetical protein